MERRRNGWTNDKAERRTGDKGIRKKLVVPIVLGQVTTSFELSEFPSVGFSAFQSNLTQ